MKNRKIILNHPYGLERFSVTINGLAKTQGAPALLPGKYPDRSCPSTPGGICSGKIYALHCLLAVNIFLLYCLYLPILKIAISPGAINNANDLLFDPAE